MVFTAYQWRQQRQEYRSLMFTKHQTASRQQCHQWHSHPKEHNGLLTITTSGMYNNQGYLARLHRSQRRALYTPDQQCPVPEDKLENYRRTIAHKADGTTEDFVEQCTDLGKQMIRKRLPGPTWSGETWFRVKQDVKPPPPPLPKVTPKKHELQRQATPKQKALQQAPEQPRQQQQGRQQPEAPLRRHTTKSPQSILPQPQHFSSNIRAKATWGSSNRRLLDQGRTSVEESTQHPKNKPICATTDTWWPGCFPTTAHTTGNCKTNIRSKRLQDRWWLDNKDFRKTQSSMDRLNKLRSWTNIQGWILRRTRRRTTASGQSNRSQDTRPANAARKSGTWTDTFAVQILVPNMCAVKRTQWQPPKATKQVTSRPIWLLLFQGTRREHQHQSSRVWMFKQACAWQFWWPTSIKTFNTTCKSYEHSFWNVAEYKQYSTAPCYKQIKKTIS